MDLTCCRWKAFLVVLVTWAAVYLPGLGKPEFKGEEGRRVLPAVEMLKTGNWVVPRIGGQDYYNKPPGINWLVAASFVLTGEQSELSARLPSAVFVLIFVALLLWMPASPKTASRGGPSPWLSVEARFISAIIFLTNIAVIEKGRLIEIEAVYISLTGIATLLWLNSWSANSSKWLLWLAPSIVLGFGMLVKGPFILIFFYSVVVSVLWYSRRPKDLLAIQHLVGLSVVLLMALGWFYLASQQTSGSKMTGQMSGQLLTRIIRKPDVIYWGRNVARSFTNFLPWLVFIPMLWDKKLTSQIEQAYWTLFRGCQLGLVTGFVVINLMPGMESRYSMPVIPLASVLLGWMLSLRKELCSSEQLWKNILLACFLASCLTAAAGLIFVTRTLIAFVVLALAICATAIVFWKRNAIKYPPLLSLVTAVFVVVAMLQYSCFGLELVTANEKRRPAAMNVNRIVPAGQTLYILKPGNQLNPVIFYIQPPISYVLDANDVNDNMHYLLLKNADLKALKAEGKISKRPGAVLYEFTDDIQGQYRLVQLDYPRD